MTAKSLKEIEDESDFSSLVRDIQTGRKPIDALLDDITFKKNLRAIFRKNLDAAMARMLKPGCAEDLATEVFRSALTSVQRFESDYLHDLESELDDLLANMQTTKSKRAMRKAFEASPAELGRAAVKQASKKR